MFLLWECIFQFQYTLKESFQTMNTQLAMWGNTPDLLYKVANAGKSKTNACRNLHILITRGKILFPVHIDAIEVRVSLRKPFLRKEKVFWPILRMGDWVKALLSECPQVLLSGYKLEQSSKWKAVFQNFWDEYKSCNGCHPVYTSNYPTDCCVPYFLHGDEGRTLRNRSFMIHSFQPLISRKGPMKCNESGYLGKYWCTYFSCLMYYISMTKNRSILHGHPDLKWGTAWQHGSSYLAYLHSTMMVRILWMICTKP